MQQQRKSSARQKAVTEVQRGAAAQLLARAPAAREVKILAAPQSSQRGSGETTLGGHVDRGLTLAALYDIGILERLRLEVRVRLFADLTQSLAWLHANQRLMAAHPHLVVAPSTVVIGLDGVARVDVRAAKKQESERNPSEADYRAPEVASGDPAADLRADIFSLGVLGWEALAGRRIGANDVGAKDGGSPELIDVSDVPAALIGREREPLRRRASRAAPTSSGPRSRVPSLSLPEDGEWAAGLAGIVLQAMSPELAERPQDCRELLSELERIAGHFASTHEIAEVVQGISAVATLCVPLPTLPDADASCQSSVDHLGFMDRQPCDAVAESCAQPRILAPRRVVEAAPPSRSVVLRASAIAAPPPSRAVLRLRAMGAGSSGPAWFAAGLFWLAVLGLLAGYAASRMSLH